MTRSVIRETVSFRHGGAVDLREVRADLPGRQPLRVKRQHDLIDAAQPPLPLLDDLRSSNVPSRSRGTSIPDLAGAPGQHRLRPALVADVAALIA